MKIHFGRNKDGFNFDADVGVEEIGNMIGGMFSGLFGDDDEKKPPKKGRVKPEEPATEVPKAETPKPETGAEPATVDAEAQRISCVCKNPVFYKDGATKACAACGGTIR